jgi:hypothetical protein
MVEFKKSNLKYCLKINDTLKISMLKDLFKNKSNEMNIISH